MGERSKKEEAVFIDTGRYLYQNHFIGFLNRFGHWVVQRIIQNKKGKIIDLGCGMGDHFPYMQGCSFVGVDSDEKMLFLAKKRFSSANLFLENIYEMSFKNESFDCAVAIGVLEHLSRLEEALKEIRRILSPNGELIVLIPTENFFYKLGRKLTVKKYIEKKYDINYDKLVESEHVNSHHAILKHLKENFKVNKKIGIPLILPFYHFNVFTVIRCLKK